MNNLQIVRFAELHNYDIVECLLLKADMADLRKRKADLRCPSYLEDYTSIEIFHKAEQAIQLSYSIEKTINDMRVYLRDLGMKI